uniref:Uncharacterized protein n=1 Tax=Eutreptiella gymnastica TaxID=73025 RepID=A0A7S4G5W6_9EUGL
MPAGVIVGGISRTFLSVVTGMVASAQRFAPPHWGIHIYDLIGDLRPGDRARMSKWCRVQVHRMQRRHDPRFLTNSDWKAEIIGEHLAALPEGGIVVYADASQRFLKPFSVAQMRQAQAIGVMGRTTVGPIAKYTHPDTIRALSALAPQVVTHMDIQDYTHAPMICGCISFWAAGALTRELILPPFSACSQNQSCIKPKGATGFKQTGGGHKKCQPGYSGKCHRGDQSVLSTILYELYNLRASSMGVPYVDPKASAQYATRHWDVRGPEPVRCHQ